MKNNWKYILVGFLIFVVAFASAMPFFGAVRFGSYAYPQGQSSWTMGSRMMGGGWGAHGLFGLFGGFGILGMWLIPLLILGLIVAGIIWVIQTVNKDKDDVEKLK